MNLLKLYDRGHQWTVFSRDPEKHEKVIDTNQYMVRSGSRVLLIEPGGIEIFAPMLTAVLRVASIEEITDLFASHQDPDIISSLGLWDHTLPNATLHAPWLWEGFIRHFGMERIQFNPISDEGGVLEFGDTHLEIIPAHYLHSSGNLQIYDHQARILMSGDVGAALEPPGSPLFVEDFDSHIDKMRGFHQRWMPSNRAKDEWIARARQLDIELMCPQHGRIFRRDDVGRFLNWFEALEVGIAVPGMCP